jgi:hypothetical protein
MPGPNVPKAPAIGNNFKAPATQGGIHGGYPKTASLWTKPQGSFFRIDNAAFEGFPERQWVTMAWRMFVGIAHFAAGDMPHNRNKLEDWFGVGTQSESDRAPVIRQLERMAEATRRNPITLVWRDIAREDSYIAEDDQFVKGTIYARAKVWSVGHEGSGYRILLNRGAGVESRNLGVFVQVVYHELSHKVLQTDDVMFQGSPCYGIDACQELALKNWKTAIENADNYGLFAQSFTVHGNAPQMGLSRAERLALRNVTFKPLKPHYEVLFGELKHEQPDLSDKDIDAEVRKTCDPDTIPYWAVF